MQNIDEYKEAADIVAFFSDDPEHGDQQQKGMLLLPLSLLSWVQIDVFPDTNRLVDRPLPYYP